MIARWRRDWKRWPRRGPWWGCVGLVVVAGGVMMVVMPEEWEWSGPEFYSNVRPVVVIDAGHGGRDNGAKVKGVEEKERTLDLAFRLEAILQQRGFPTVLTREEDAYVSLEQRVAIANRLKEKPLFISLHFNRGVGRGTNGVETYYAKRKEQPLSQRGWRWLGFFNPPDSSTHQDGRLAADVQAGIVGRTGARDRGTRKENFFVTRRARGPAILIEGGFLSDQMERHLLGSSFYLNRMAEGIADGIERWCEMQPNRRRSEGRGALGSAER